MMTTPTNNDADNDETNKMKNVEKGAPLPTSANYRIFLVAFAMFQITLAAGLIVGWAGIAGTMLIAKPIHAGGAGGAAGAGAGLTLDDTTALFSLAAAVNYISPFFLGILLDHMGPRACSTTSNALVSLGCFVFGSCGTFGDPSSSPTFATTRTVAAIGISLVAFGGPGVQTSLIHTGSLFPERRFFVMGVVAETITLSFAIFPLLDVIWEKTGMSFQELFYGLGVLVALSAVCSFTLWPDQTYEVIEVSQAEKESHGSSFLDKTEDEIEEQIECDHVKEATDAFSGSTLSAKRQDSSKKNNGNDAETASLVAKAQDSSSNKTKRLQDASFQEQLLSGVYIRLVIFFGVTSYWANFYIASVTIEMGDLQLFTFDEQHLLARQLSFIDAGAILCAPLSGYLLDVVGFVETAYIAITVGIFQMILLLLAGGNTIMMAASFVCYAVFRAFLFPYFFASLSKKIGFRYFGILSGLAFSLSGLVQLSIGSLAGQVMGNCHNIIDNTFEEYAEESCNKGQWLEAHMVQIATLVLLLLVPYYERRAEAKDKKAVEATSAAASAHSCTSSSSDYGSV